MNRQSGRGRPVTAAVCAVAAWGALAALPGQAWAAADPSGYVFAPDAVTVTGEEANADAAFLTADKVYRSSIGPGQKLYYRVTLDAGSDAYVSAVAVPRDPAGKVAYGDGITVSIRDDNDVRCGSESANFGAGEFARPITAYGFRENDPDGSSCQRAGTYDVLVERDSKETSSQEIWDLELRHAVEPALKSPGSMPTGAPEDFPSESPAPLPTSAPRGERAGGSGYFDATGLETGEWKDSVAPGRTRFFRVPVDWGQQLWATAEISNDNSSDAYVGSALVLSADNPALGHVDSAALSYSGRPATAALSPLPPVDHANRNSSATRVSAMRYAGWYYLSVGLSPAVAEAYGDDPIRITLKVRVENAAEESPYQGGAGIFGVDDDDREMARNGQSAADAGRDGTLMIVGVAGIGVGTVLVLGLGAWTLLARRAAGAVAVPDRGRTEPRLSEPYGGRPPGR
ncbi:hypothetical protein [uncultured Streptomyces sp.]|uniref:hypothetical protein n=1 Tax=uncultured Streptomyces sp. TaxID=174707 RepID=UPI00261C2066|nr:hypothetical protein [uncultured Streptomyces sp.]